MYTVAEAKPDYNNTHVVVNNWPFGGRSEHVGYDTKFVPAPDKFGRFKTNIEAKRKLVTNFYPELADCSDEHIKRVCKEFISGSMAHYKIVRC